MKSSTAANSAIYILDNTVIGGRAISVSLYETFTKFDHITPTSISGSHEGGGGGYAQEQACQNEEYDSSIKGTWVVRLLHHGVNNKSVSISPIDAIVSQVGDQPVSVWTEEMSPVENSETLVLSQSLALQNLLNYKSSSQSLSPSSVDNYLICTHLPWGILQFSSVYESIVAMQRLSGIVVGGQEVTVGMYDFNVSFRLLASLSPDTDLRAYEKRNHHELIPLCDHAMVEETDMKINCTAS